MKVYLSCILFFCKMYIFVSEMIVSDKFFDRYTPTVITPSKKSEYPSKIWLSMNIEDMNRIEFLDKSANIAVYDISIGESTIEDKIIFILYTLIEYHLKYLDCSSSIFMRIVSSVFRHPSSYLIEVDHIVCRLLWFCKKPAYKLSLPSSRRACHEYSDLLCSLAKFFFSKKLFYQSFSMFFCPLEELITCPLHRNKSYENASWSIDFLSSSRLASFSV